MNLQEWAAWRAKVSKETSGPQLPEPILTAVRLGWDRVIATGTA